jgi:hypothetical protein
LLKIYQLMQMILGGKRPRAVFLVFGKPAGEVIGHTNVKHRVGAVGEDVNVAVFVHGKSPKRVS